MKKFLPVLLKSLCFLFVFESNSIQGQSCTEQNDYSDISISSHKRGQLFTLEEGCGTVLDSIQVMVPQGTNENPSFGFVGGIGAVDQISSFSWTKELPDYPQNPPKDVFYTINLTDLPIEDRIVEVGETYFFALLNGNNSITLGSKFGNPYPNGTAGEYIPEMQRWVDSPDELDLYFKVFTKSFGIVSQPLQAVACGDSAGFSVEAEGSPLEFVWQKSDGGGFVNVPNSNNDTLILSDLSFSDNGWLFRCIVIGETENDTSDLAQLVVPRHELEVVSTNDEGCGSLRYAMDMASEGDTIYVNESLSGDTIKLVHGQIEITKSITLLGQGVVIDGGGSSRLFYAEDLDSLIFNETVLVGGGQVDKGAGLYTENIGKLQLKNCVFANHSGVSGWRLEGIGLFCTYAYDVPNASVLITGCTFDGNHYSNGSYVDVHGGALYVRSQAAEFDLVVEDNQFINGQFGTGGNIEGAAVRLALYGEADALIKSNSFLNNLSVYGGASGKGGALFIQGSGNSEIEFVDNVVRENGLISDNNSAWGGGAYFISYDDENSTVWKIEGNNVVQNFVHGYSVEGGGLRFSGQGELTSITLNLENNSLDSNQCLSQGSGYRAKGGGLYLDVNTYGGSLSATMLDNSFVGNYVEGVYEGHGGGAYMQTDGTIASVDIVRNQFDQNQVNSFSDVSGGGLYLDFMAAYSTSSMLVVEDNSFSKNRVSELENDNITFSGYGAGAYLLVTEQGQLTFEQNTIDSNSATAQGSFEGAGVYLFAKHDLTEVNVTQNRIFGNQVVANEDDEYNFLRGGGFFGAVNYYGVLNLNENEIYNNSISSLSKSEGGGVYLSGREFAEVNMQGNEVYDNELNDTYSSVGAGVYLDLFYKSASNLIDNQLNGNKSTTRDYNWGGGLNLHVYDTCEVNVSGGQISSNSLTLSSTDGMTYADGAGASCYIEDGSVLNFRQVDILENQIHSLTANSDTTSSQVLGGGLYVFTTRGSQGNLFGLRVAKNSAFSLNGCSGGGLYGESHGKESILTISASSFSSNFIETSDDATNSKGGGVSLYLGHETRVQFDRNTLDSNWVLTKQMVKGGGLSVQNHSMSQCDIWYNTIVGNQSLVSEKEMAGSSFGGGLWVDNQSSSIDFKGNSVVGNKAQAPVTMMGGGASFNNQGGTIFITSNLFSSNSVGEQINDLSLEDDNMGVQSYGYNLLSSNNGVEDEFPAGEYENTNDTVGTIEQPIDPLLGNLSNNGGLTMTIPLLQGSPAIDRGEPKNDDLDQRGHMVYGVRDVGAFELNGLDTIRPTPVCKTVVLKLDVNGTAVLDSASLDGGSYAPSGVKALQPSQSSFYCSAIGANQIELRVVANNERESTCLGEVVVLPYVNTQNISCKGMNNGVIQVGCDYGVSGAMPIENGPNIEETVKYSIDGVNYFSSRSFESLSPGRYVLRMRVRSRVFVVDTLILTEPEQGLEVTATPINPMCSYESGKIRVEASGGEFPYLYSLDGGETWQQSNVFDDVAIGEFQVTVSDAKGCSVVSDSINVVAPKALSGNILVQDASCFGVNDGLVEISPIGGSSPYLYVLDNDISYDTTDVGRFENLSPGEYEIIIVDGNSCAYKEYFVISSPSELLLDYKFLGIQECSSLKDSLFEFSVMGGTPPYSWLANEDLVDSIDFSLLSPGDYVFVVKDANGCEAGSRKFQKAPSSPLNAVVAVRQEVLCFGQNQGSLVVTASGGEPPYSVSYDNGENYFIDSLFAEGLAAGNYGVWVKDAVGCTVYLGGYDIFQPEFPLGFEVTGSKNISCLGGKDGRIIAHPTGGAQPYSYSKDGVNFDLSQPLFEGFEAGVHQVYVKDANGCIAASEPITISQPQSALYAEVVLVSEPKCHGEESGEIHVIPGGGVPPYSLYLNGELQNTFTLNQLAAGKYGLELRDSRTCMLTLDSVEVSEPQPLVLEVLSKGDASCEFASDGFVDLQASGGTNDYSFRMEGGPWQSEASFNGLLAGTYLFHVMDDMGCIAATQVTLVAPEAIQLILNASGTSCHGGADGIIEVSSMGHQGQVLYRLNQGEWQELGQFDQLAAGSYTVELMDENGCMAIGSAEISEPEAITLDLLSQEEVSCFGGNDGAFTVEVSGGQAPYVFRLDGQVIATTQLEGLSAKSYTLEVEDENGCVQTRMIEVVQPDEPLVLSLDAVINATCDEGAQVSVHAEGGTLPYTYSLNGGQGQSIGLFNGLPVGSYLVEVRDANGCLASLDSVTIEPVELPEIISINATQILCHGESSTVEVIAEGEGLTYSIDGVNFQAGNTFDEIYAGPLTVWVRNEGGCVVSQLKPILHPQKLELNASPTDVSCWGLDDGSILLQVEGGNTPYQYRLNGGDWQASSSFDSIGAGMYSVEVIDLGGCIRMLEVEVQEPEQLILEASVNHALPNESNGAISMSAMGGTSPYQFGYWDWQQEVLSETGDLIEGLAPGTYTVGVLDNNGCLDTLELEVEEGIGLAEVEEAFELQVYPNPSTNWVEVSLTSAVGMDQIVLMNALGELVLSVEMDHQHKQRLDLTGLAKGTYFMRVNGKFGTAFRTLIIQ